MAHIDGDVYEALASTKAGKRVIEQIAREMSPDDPQRLPDWMLGWGRTSLPQSKRYVAAVAEALYSGRPNVTSVTMKGADVRREIKRRLLAIVGGSE